METESASNEEENNEQNKRDHIKERLKDLGVSQDSVRPQKSWISRNINNLILAVVVVLVGAFIIEYQSSQTMKADNSQLAEQNTASDQAVTQVANPYYSNQPTNGSMGMQMQPPIWTYPQYAENRENSSVGGQPKEDAEIDRTVQNGAENNPYGSADSGWYAQQRFYGQSYQQPQVQNQDNTQRQEQRSWAENRQPTYHGQYDNNYNRQYYNYNYGPTYNPYYPPMPNTYSMPYPNAGYYNGWYR